MILDKPKLIFGGTIGFLTLVGLSFYFYKRRFNTKKNNNQIGFKINHKKIAQQVFQQPQPQVPINKDKKYYSLLFSGETYTNALNKIKEKDLNIMFQIKIVNECELDNDMDDEENIIMLSIMDENFDYDRNKPSEEAIIIDVI